MSESKERTKVESLTLSQIMVSMKPGQLWTILVIVFGLLSGSFGLGYKAKAYVGESELARLHDTIKQFRGLQTKERFLGLYLRYLTAQDSHAESASEETQRAMEEAASHFRSYIDELLERGEQAQEEIDLTGLFLGKGGTSEATVKFGYDGSIWPIPPEFGYAAAE